MAETCPHLTDRHFYSKSDQIWPIYQAFMKNLAWRVFSADSLDLAATPRTSSICPSVSKGRQRLECTACEGGWTGMVTEQTCQRGRSSSFSDVLSILQPYGPRIKIHRSPEQREILLEGGLSFVKPYSNTENKTKQNKENFQAYKSFIMSNRKVTNFQYRLEMMMVTWLF